jgi:hypothetical protein
VSGLNPCCVVLCCAVLCCAVLCCAVLCCAVLCCAVLCCAALHCAVLCCAVLRCPVLCCAVLCCHAGRLQTCRARCAQTARHASLRISGLRHNTVGCVRLGGTYPCVIGGFGRPLFTAVLMAPAAAPTGGLAVFMAGVARGGMPLAAAAGNPAWRPMFAAAAATAAGLSACVATAALRAAGSVPLGPRGGAPKPCRRDVKQRCGAQNAWLRDLWL